MLSKTKENNPGLPYNSCYKDLFIEFQLNKTIIYYLKSKNIEYKLCAELEFIETIILVQYVSELT